jgi:L,D-peptidoglycan transpeptidase YkuD (ErfK/YbiS/YcfS/YnhG family)
MRNRVEHDGVGKHRAREKAASVCRDLRVHSLSPAATRGWIIIGWLRVPCAMGRSGRRAIKREGDEATPSGVFRLRHVYYRADRVKRPRTLLPARPLKPAAGWCDSIGDRNYNRKVAHPYPRSAEMLWREDALYDLIVITNHNERPRVQGGGSAIFVHVAQPSYSGTAGCVAVKKAHLLRLLARLNSRTRLRIPR